MCYKYYHLILSLFVTLLVCWYQEYNASPIPFLVTELPILLASFVVYGLHVHVYYCYCLIIVAIWHVFRFWWPMEGVDGHLAVIRAKPYHKPPKNEFHANFYDILLLKINNGEVGRGLKGLPQLSIPYHEDPREKVLDCLYMLTGADRGGIRGKLMLLLSLWPISHTPYVIIPLTHWNDILVRL